VNGAQVKAAVEKNKVALGAGGVGIVALLALRQRSKGGGSSSGRVVPAGSGTYDSTASDVYNSIQPEIESLRDQIDLLSRLNPSAQPTPTPTPADPSPVSSSISAYVMRDVAPISADPSPVAGYASAPAGMQSSPIVVQDKLIGVQFTPRTDLSSLERWILASDASTRAESRAFLTGG
jgi:hypothetical protein